MKSKNSNAGFSLIETLFVISIIGFLATLGAVVLKNARIKSRDTKILGDINQVRKAMELIISESGTYAVEGGMEEICFGETCFEVPSDGTLSNCDFSPYLEAERLADPLNISDECTGDNANNCNYTFWRLPTGSHYLFFVHLEGSTALGNSGLTNCAISETMITCDNNISFSYCNASGLGGPNWDTCRIFDFNGSGIVSNADKGAYDQ